MKKQLPGWAVLLIITLAAGLALGGTYALTKDPIDQQAMLTAEKARKAVLPDADSFEKLAVNEDAAVNWAYAGRKDGNIVGYVAQNTVTGFGGEVEVTVGTNTMGVLSGVRVGGTNFSETAGLGARAKEPAFYEQFAGKEYPLDLIKYGGEIDAITSASITSGAVVRGVNSAIKFLSEVGGFKINEPISLVDELGNNRYATTKQGFGGPVYVELEIADGVITDVVIGDESFAESAGYGARAKEEAFYSQYIGKSGTGLTLNSDVDQVSGATITSTAVNDAVNLILLYVNDPDAFNAQMADQPEEVDVSIPAGAETFTVQANGLSGTFNVTIGIGEDGAVNGIAIGDSSTEADVPFLGKVKNSNAFLAQFIGATGSLNENEVDLVSGATVSSKAVISAVNKAYAASKGEVIEEPAVTEAPAETKAAAENSFTASAQGFGGPVAVSAAFDAEGKITSISIGDSSFNETTGLGAKALEDSFQAQFIGKQMPLTLADIDAIAGATVTSTAVVDALNAAYEKSLSGEEAGTEEEPAQAETASAYAFKDIRNTATIATQKNDLQVKVSFVQNTVAGLVVMERPAGTEQAYALSGLDAEMKNLFLAATLPLAVEDQETSEAALVASAINAAYYAQGGAVKAKPAPASPAEPEIIGGADEPTAIILPATVDSDGWYTSEVICFFTAVKVEAQFADGKVAALNVSDKQIGSEKDFAPSSRQAAMEAQFVGAALPIDNNQMTPYASAVAIALNQAFGASGQTVADESALPSGVGIGSSVMFFSEYTAVAAFDGNQLVNYIVYTVPVSGENPEEAVSLDNPALQEALIGREMPLNPDEFKTGIGGSPAYVVNAIVIAINDAYNQSSAGQQ